MLTTVFVVIIVGVIVLLVASNVRIVPQSENYVIERLGAYKETWNTGLKFKVPFIERVAKKVSLKEKVIDFPAQAVITKDNVTIEIDSVIFYQVMDSKLYTYGAENPLFAIENITATTLRNLIGELTLDETLTSRDHVNTNLRMKLDEATDAWGIKVNRVELKDIVTPQQIKESMEKQMKAERERREKILKAEGDKTSEITRAEGEKESVILRAQADLESAKLRAEAQRTLAVTQAKGEAESIRIINSAQAEAIERINQAQVSPEYTQIRALEAFEKVAQGQATKIIIPSQIQDLTSLFVSLKDTLQTPFKEEQ
ncbi:regulator of protease activity HflC (stomatin/prohibitin superfamily) [Paenibacillus sp. 1182]|uniref:SPFH domain-containing protein n=1 Tax=Paenibacillus sp. 1182 TaxID=2806565 RepID=UPI001AE76C0A|nr:SPFH domain-containing protein [Paenibacillus sp. 1182]MBP1308906.1 regulator of protease activity HflC (stomatin/prohibitin superfamily) [Paenibacillus sp. 1182]